MKNKYQRIQKEKHIHKKRCETLGLDPKKHYQYKSQAKPCSCEMCSPLKYNRAKNKVVIYDET